MPTVLIDRIGLLERLKSSCAAAQAVLAHSLVESQTADGAARKVRPAETRRSVAAQVALARRDSRHRGGRLVGLAGALVNDIVPHARGGATTIDNGQGLGAACNL